MGQFWRWCIWLSWLALPGQALASGPVDSLRTLLARPGQPDTARASLCHQLARKLMRTDLPGARRYAAQGHKLARRARDERREMILLNDMAACAYYAHDLLAAQPLFEELVHGARRTGQRVLLGHAYLGLGNVMGDFDEVERAHAYYQQARQIYASCDPPEILGQALILNNTANHYLNTGQVAKAGRPVRQGNALIGRFKHPWLDLTLLDNLARLQRAEHHTDSAIRTLQQVIRLANARDDQTDESSALATLAEIQITTDPAGALPLVRRSLMLARAIEDPLRVSEGLRVQALLLQRLGQSRAAFDTLLRYEVLHDTLSGQELHEAIAKQQVRFDVAQQKDRIRNLEQQRRISRLRAERQAARTRTYGIAAVSLLALVLVGSGLLALLVRSRRRLQASEADLRTANATKDELMRIIGHDLRGPVAGFQQLTPLLHEVMGQSDPTDAHQLIRTLDAGAQQLGGLVDNLFQWTRARSSQVVNRPVSLPAETAVESVAGLYEPVAQSKGIHLVHAAPPDLRVWADPDLLTTVLRNLVGNALKFTPAGGTVTLQAAPATGAVEFSVTDTGTGMKAAQLAGLFTADRVASTPGLRGEPGTGLGLPLCARFVRLLGGELRAESQPGHGSRFWFRVTNSE